MRRIAIAFAALLALALPGDAQVDQDVLPPNTVVGRTGIGTGPAQAIPFANLFSLLGPIANSSLANMGANTVKCNPTSIAATPTDCSYPTFNVKDFGAKCDGSTDDSSAINAAITAANTATGGTVVVPSGTCIAQGLVMRSFVTIAGQGRTASVIQGKSGTTGAVLATLNFATLTGTNTIGGPYKWGLRDITIDGNKAGRASGDAIDIYGYDFIFQNVDVRNAPGANIYSEWSTSGAVPVSSGGDGMEARLVDVKTFSAGGNGITWNGPHDSQFVNILSFINTGGGLNFTANGTVGGNASMLSNVHTYGNGTWGIITNTLIFPKGVISESNLAGGGIQANSGAQLIGGAISVFNNVGPGLQLNSGANGNYLSSVYAANNSGASGIGIQISSNNSTLANVAAVSNSQQGVLFGASAANNVINGINAILNTGVGISINGQQNVLESATSNFNPGGGISFASGTTGNKLTGVASGNTGTQLALSTLGGSQNVIDATVIAGANTSWTGTVANNDVRINSDKGDSHNAIGGALLTYTPAPSCGTATFTVNSAHFKTLSEKTTFVQANITITAIGTCTSPISFTLPNTPNTSGALIGRETVNSFKAVDCVIAATVATTGCLKADLSNFAVNDNIVLSGTYENQ